MSSLQKLNLLMNQVSGSLPEMVPEACVFFQIGENDMTGPLPQDGLAKLKAVDTLCLWGNRFEGMLPWLRSMSSVIFYVADSNKLDGSILEHAFPNKLQYLCIYNNQLSGVLPERGLKSISLMSGAQ
eukprot:4329977-Amphidinium_carterae.1